MLMLYSAVGYVLVPLLIIYTCLRSLKNPDYRKNMQQRIGVFNDQGNTSMTIVIHAVSVGEVRAITPVVKRLLDDYPDYRILITTTTPTGKDQVHGQFGHKVDHAYLPWDVAYATNRFIRQVRPVLFIIVETELWPNLFSTLNKYHVPLLIVNARMSEKSLQAYLRFKSITQAMMDNVNLLYAQTHDHADRFIQMGMDRNKLAVTGNLKFDFLIPEDAKTHSETLKQGFHNRSVWVAASTHEGEEHILLAAHAQARKSISDLLMILVPRHPERFDRVYGLAAKSFKTTRYSTIQDVDQDTGVIIGDVMGQLMTFYYAVDLAFIGGSLIDHGGQNPVEAAAAGLPLIMGPSQYNFEKMIQDMIKGGAMIEVARADQLADAVCNIIKDSTLHAQMAETARMIYQDNQGATDRVIEAIGTCLHPQLK